VHGSSCEAGLVTSADVPVVPVVEGVEAEPQKQNSATRQEPVAESLASSEALAAFDQAWQTIYDTHFDPTFNGVDWQALKAELRPRAEAAHSRAELREVIDDMLGRLGQSHFTVIPSDALPAVAGARDESGGLGFDVRLREGRLLVVALEAGGAAAAAGVKLGWCVQRIGSFDVEETLARMRKAEQLGERKLAFTLWAASLAHVHGPVGGRETVAFLDGDDRPVELALERKKRDVTAHEFGPTLPIFYLEFGHSLVERDGKRIGTLHFSNWFLPIVKPLNEALDAMHELDGIVIDLRGNTGGAAAMTMGVSGHFFAESKKLGVMTTRDSTLNILAFPRTVNSAGELLTPFAGPLALVIDETTGSASEVFAGGLQALGRARVFGETSAGAVLPAVTTVLPNGDTLLHALGDFETSTGVRLEGRGVVPDVVVPLQREGLIAGRDASLEAALDWIANQGR
jgi:carboxyl-terminal processing protease